MMNRWKQKYTTKSVKEKSNSLNDLKNGMSNKAKKYGVPKNELANWVEYKLEILKNYEAGHVEQQRLKTEKFENIGAGTYK